MLGSFFYVFILTFLTSCANNMNQSYDLVKIDYTNGSSIISEKLITEIKEKVPQDAEFFASQIPENIIRLVQDKQFELYNHYYRVYFSPWTELKNDLPTNDFSICNSYHENNRMYPLKNKTALINNVKNAHYIDKKAIVVNDTIIKLFPTNSMFFKNMNNPGDYYPFDLNIMSRVKVGVPLKAIAISQDKQWCFVSCPFFSGWICLKDMAYVDNDFVKKYQSYPLGVCIKENTTIDNGNGFINSAEIGTILPLKDSKVLCPVRNAHGYAELVQCNSANFTIMPIKFNITNVKDIANQFLTQEYGWGGYLGHRDCSMLTMDFFSVFGICLPRNGNAQLMTNDNIKLQRNKRKQILELAIPWITIAGKPGHVMLYVGEYKGNPVFFHNIYALRNKRNPYDRIIIGDTVFMTDFQNSFCDSISLFDLITIMRNAIPSDMLLDKKDVFNQR